MEQFNDYQFENYLVERALPMMLQDPVVRPSLIQNAIFFIGNDNLDIVLQDYIGNPPPMAPMNMTPPMGHMIIDELGTPASSGAVTDSEYTPNGGKRRKRTRKRRKRRKSRQ